MTNSKPAPQGSLPFGASQNTFFNEEPPATQHQPSGGAERDRTDDLLLAKQALSQLSYSPFWLVVGLGRLELPTSRLSSARSNQLSYKPVTGFYKSTDITQAS